MFKCKKSITQNIVEKFKNDFPIRVLYKKTNKIPEIKIISSVKKLKKSIVKNNLSIIPYDTVFIICPNQKLVLHTTPNILLPLKSIYGDLIIVKIDKKQREFQGLSQDDIMWYSQDLINKSISKYNTNYTNSHFTNSCTNFHKQNFNQPTNTTFNFEKELLNELVNIEVILSSIVTNENTNK